MTAQPTTEPDAAAREALAKGIAEFNAWRFYDCHETLEDAWREIGGKGRADTFADLYQGIIKTAAGFHHLLRGNHKGTVNLLSDALRLLSPYEPAALGINVQEIYRQVRGCLDRVEELGPKGLGDFDRSTIPRIDFNEASSDA